MKKSIVISRYKEDLSWTSRLDPNVKKFIYNKGEINNDFISLPNIGRESHTFLYHIVNHYQDLTDIIIFTQGNPLDHCPDAIHLINTSTSYTPLWKTQTLYPEPITYQWSVHSQEVWNVFNPEYKHPDVLEFYPGAQCVVLKEQILYHKKEVYEKLLYMHILEENKNLMFGNSNSCRKQYDGITPMPWIIERYWRYIWEKFYYNEI
jgi:hypothetical protein